MSPPLVTRAVAVPSASGDAPSCLRIRGRQMDRRIFGRAKIMDGGQLTFYICKEAPHEAEWKRKVNTTCIGRATLRMRDSRQLQRADLPFERGDRGKNKERASSWLLRRAGKGVR